MFGQTGNEPKCRHFDTQASQSRVYTGRVIIVIIAEREDKGEERKRMRKVRRTRTKEEKGREEREKGEREAPRVYRHHAHMCFNMRARCRCTRGRFESTHGGFSLRAKPRHTPQHSDAVLCCVCRCGRGVCAVWWWRKEKRRIRRETNRTIW